MLDPQKYTVGWICALPTEFDAAQAFLDDEHDDLPPVSRHDNNSYALGTMGVHNVVIAVLPDGEYGLTSAAAVARDMLHSFPNVRIGLMVGIGGGAPSSKHDVRLGDIVVSSRDGGKGGVFQYDFGKAVQNQDVSFEHTDFLDQPPMVLRTAVSALKSRYKRKGHQLNADVERVLDRWPRLRREYSRPSSDSDKLYQSSFIHPDSSKGCKTVCSNGPSILVERKTRAGDEDDPAIHYGLIASASQLMKDSTLRDKLATEKGVLCFEMEAAGLMNHFPCLVIRGICDYSDSHKNKEWQGFAAMMAAAYAKDLLRQIPPNKVEAEGRIGEVLGLIQDNLDHMQETTNEINATTVTLRNDQHAANLHKWLSPPNSSTNFNHARQKCHEGSGLWFLSSPIYKEWKQGLHRHLWLHGLAGSGKTVLSTTIVDDLRKKDDCVILEFYFDFSDNTKQRLDGVLRSLIFQLYAFGHNTQDLDSLYDCLLKGQKQPDTKALESCFGTMAKGIKTTYIVLDALDESTERDQLLNWMKEFFTTLDLRHICLIATSRPEDVFLKRLPGWIGEGHCFSLDKAAVNADIHAYVTAQLEQRPAFVEKRLSCDLISQIRDRVGNGADGMFRWAACQLDSLAACQSPQDIETTLNSLPEDLNQTYQRMLDSIPPKQKKKAVRLLHFMVHVDTPLSLSEAIDVIATQADEKPQGFNLKARPFEGASILHYCPGLVSIVEVPPQEDWGQIAEELHLSHFSVKEYLLEEGGFDLMRSSVVITQTCLAYLKDTPGHYNYDIRIQFPLKQRAARIWMRYAVFAESSEDTVSAILAFLENETTFRSWNSFYEVDGPWWREIPRPRPSRLYYACSGGLLRSAGILLDNEANVNVQGGHFGNALQAASVRGYLEIVRILLEKGANISAKGGYFSNALQAASFSGHSDTVRFLLDKGADVNAKGDVYSTALYAASSKGHLEVVELLLDNGADINPKDDKHDNALYAASFWGNLEVVKLLIGRGASVNVNNRFYSDLLQAASETGSLGTVQLLLDKGADISTQAGHLQKALYAASIRGALEVASRFGHLNIAQLLLDKGAEVNARALSSASSHGHLDIVQLLLDKGVDVTGDDFHSALCFAVTEGYLNIVRLLLHRIKVVGGHGRSYSDLLRAASEMGHSEIVQELLDSGAKFVEQEKRTVQMPGLRNVIKRIKRE